jgi:hypothetical protein
VDHKNIHLFSFNGRTDITTDLNHYKDSAHYAAWINSLMLKWMHEGTYQLTEDNYEERIHEEYEFYSTFDNSLLDGQPDYEDDYYAAALLNQELTGAAPLDVLHADPEIVHLEQVSFAQNGAEPGSAESGGSDQDGTEPDGTEQSGVTDEVSPIRFDPLSQQTNEPFTGTPHPVSLRAIHLPLKGKAFGGRRNAAPTGDERAGRRTFRRNAAPTGDDDEAAG